MSLFYEQEAPKVNIIITWLLVFMSSLEYQLDPIKNGFNGVYKSQKYYDFRVELEIMLAKYFEIALKMLIYSLKYQFNPKCHILNILYQSTYQYYFLH